MCYVVTKCNSLFFVRFQVLTAASMMFRIVFWDVLPVILHDSTFQKTILNIIVFCFHSLITAKGFSNKLQEYYNVCERLHKLIGKKVIAIQTLNSQHYACVHIVRTVHYAFHIILRSTSCVQGLNLEPIFLTPCYKLKMSVNVYLTSSIFRPSF
jgi:hypothetical protein